MPRILAANLAEHRELVQNSLFDALDGLLDERDFEAITMSDIAARAGVARNTVYNYASDKVGLLSAAVRRSTDDVESTVRDLSTREGDSPSERLTAIVRFLLTSFSRSTHRVFVLQARVASLDVAGQEMAGAAIESVQSQIARVLNEGADAGEFRRSADLEVDLALISGVLAAAVQRSAASPASTADVAEQAEDFILSAMRSRARR